MIDSAAYCQRIGYQGNLAPTAQTLRQLHEAHMLAVPFENLDIELGRQIRLDEALLLHKIVEQRRGGFCYELNGAFAALLRSLGFAVDLLSARVAHKTGGFGPEFDHLTLLVQAEEPWLADVGFGDSFRAPLHLRADKPQQQAMGAYWLTQAGEQWTLLQFADEAWRPQYQFTLQPHALADFAPMCHFHQTSPESHFTQQRICTRATPDGRITLSDDRLIVTANDNRTERFLPDDAAYQDALRTYFGITLDVMEDAAGG
jgi:N-hydroxyarylamine O-acetyltransferase